MNDKILKIGEELNIKYFNFDYFINTHVKLRIKNKDSLNLISNDLGFSDIRDFVKQYINYMLLKNSKDLDIINLIYSNNCPF